MARGRKPDLFILPEGWLHTPFQGDYAHHPRFAMLAPILAAYGVYGLLGTYTDLTDDRRVRGVGQEGDGGMGCTGCGIGGCMGVWVVLACGGAVVSF